MASQKAAIADSADSISVQGLVLQFTLMSLIFYMWSSPVIQPVKIMVVLFHEMSHGLMAIVTGGKVISIWITAEEGGACETEGGIPLLIVSAGYLGSMLFGGTILYLSKFRKAVPIVYGFLTLILLSAIVTVLADSYSRTFAIAMAGAFIFVGIFAPGLFGGLLLRVIGTISCLYSIIDIYCDVLVDRGGYQIQNDAVIFSQLSGISPQMAGMVWLGISVVFFLFVLKMTLAPVPEESKPMASGKEAPARA